MWTAWTSGSFSAIEGKPIASSGQRFEYDGDSFNFYGGVDRYIAPRVINDTWLFGDVRVGLAAGVNKTDLKVNFDPTTGSSKNDTVKRRMHLLVPYLHWHNNLTGATLRFYAGAGQGEIEVLEANGCNATLDTSSSFVGISGDYVVLDHNEWTAIFYGDSAQWETLVRGGITYNRNRIKTGNCQNIGSDFPESSGRNGELRFGAHFAYRATPIRHSFGLETRRLFGDINSTAYDIVGNLDFDSVGILGFSGGAEGRAQLNSTDHQRNTLSGWLAYRRGVLTSSLRTEIISDNNEPLPLKHRFQINMEDGHWRNSLGGEWYIEHAPHDSTNKLGAEMQLRF